MARTSSVAPPSPSPAAMGAAGQANLGPLCDIIPITKAQALIRTKIAGWAYEFDNGFVYQPDDAPPQAYRWDQVSTVNWYASQHYVNGAYQGTNYWLALVSGDGRNLKFSGSGRDPAARGGRNADPRAAGYLLYKFLIRVRDKVSSAQFPSAVAALGRGEPLAFGDLQISTAGIQAPKGFVPWSSIKAVNIDQGRVSVRQEGKFFSLSSQGAEKIPNCPLFLTLAQMMTRQAAASGS
jgi:hypothetical protein